jgi:molybdopterin-containing oxidoreductase family membrane subunit
VFVIAVVVNIGMWFERFVIVVTSLHHDFLPSSWSMFAPTWVDLVMFLGSFGLFFTLFLLFCRFLPMVAMAEVKTVMPLAHPRDSDSPLRFDYQPKPDTPKELQRGHWFT